MTQVPLLYKPLTHPSLMPLSWPLQEAFLTPDWPSRELVHVSVQKQINKSETHQFYLFTFLSPALAQELWNLMMVPHFSQPPLCPSHCLACGMWQKRVCKDVARYGGHC